MAEIFFYTDPESIVNQLNDSETGEAFGPISPTQYQITNRHKTNTQAKAIAVFSGTIVAVDTGTAISLILKPEKSIKELTSLDIPNIKYVIYKGIKRQSIIDADPTKIAPAATNDLTQAIWDTQAANNTSFGTAFDPGISALRLDEILDSDESIDKLFEGYVGSVFEPEKINAGDYLGDFVDGLAELFGIEFVFDELRSKVTFEESKNQNFKIDTSSISGNARIKNAKERVLHFMDPTTFYGSLYPVEKGILAYRNQNGDIINYEGPNTPGSAPSLYQLLLSKLFTRNRIYLDFRNEYGRSYNNLGVYSDSIKLKLGKKQSDFDITNYYTFFNEWPIMGIDTIVSGLSVFDPGDSTSKDVEIGFKLPIAATVNDNVQPLILLYHDYFRFKGLSKKIKPIKPKEKFINPNIDTGDTNFFEELTFNIANDKFESESTGITTPVSTYIRLKIYREISRLNPSITVHRQENYIDSLILPFENTPKYTSGLEMRAFKEDIYMGTDVDISSIPDADKDGNNPPTDYISSTGYAFDLFNVTFFTFANRKKIPSERNLISISPIQYFEEGSFLETMGKLNPVDGDDSFVKAVINLPIPGFPNERQELYRFIPQSELNPELADFSTDFSAIVISRNTYSALLNEIDSGTTGLNPNYDIHLVIRNRQNNLSNVVIESSPGSGVWDNTGEKLPYAVYELWLRGMIEDGTGDNVTTLEWNANIILLSMQSNTIPTKSFIIVEQGTNFPNLKRDTNLPCFKDTLNLQEKNDLEALVNYIDGLPGISFRPNADIFSRVFRHFADPNPGQEEQNYKCEIEQVPGSNPAEYHLVYKNSSGTILTELPNGQVKGFMMEAATIFAIYNVLLDLLKPEEDNYIYERMLRILTKNGLKPEALEDPGTLKAIKARLFSPFHHFGNFYGKDPDNVINSSGAAVTINKLLTTDFYINQSFDYSLVDFTRIRSIGEMIASALGDRTSFKEEVYNMIRSGNFSPIESVSLPNGLAPNASATLSAETQMFNIPSNLVGRSLLSSPTGVSPASPISLVLDPDVRSFLEKLVGKIASEINLEFKMIISKNARCFYRVFTKNLTFKDSFDPILRMAATGCGTTTSGLLNFGGSITLRSQNFMLQRRQTFGPFIFTYNFDSLGNAQGTYTETFPQITKETSVSVHLSIYGMDKELTPDIVEIELNGNYVGGSVGNKVLMRFVGDQYFPDDKKKLFPEHSLFGGSGATTPHLTFPTTPGAQREERVNLETFGTSLSLISGTTSHPDIVESDFAFVDINGDIAGIYLAKWNNLVITKKPPYSITVRIYSGQGKGPTNKLPVHKLEAHFEEMQLAFNIAETISSNVKQLKLPAQNFYPDDKFELTSLQKKNLIINQDLYPDAIDAYKQLAQLIYNAVDANPDNGGIPASNMLFNLSGKNIGRPKREVSSSNSLHHLIRDIRFAFDKPRPATLATTLSDPTWTEIVPSSSTVDLPLDNFLYHPNDVNKDKTRLLEVPAWLPPEYNKQIRFSFGSVTVVFTSNNKGSLIFKVESFVSPIWSRLDEKVQNDYRHTGGGTIGGLTQTQRINLLKSLTLYNNGSNGSDAYVKLSTSNFIPSYNPILSCLRSFGLLEAIRDNIAFMVSDTTYGLGITDPGAGDAVREEIQTAINTIVIPANTNLGYTVDITYDIYNKLKWYSSAADNALYGNTI